MVRGDARVVFQTRADVASTKVTDVEMGRAGQIVI